MTRVTIVVRGGVVQGIYSSDPPAVECVVVDFDRDEADRVYQEPVLRQTAEIAGMIEKADAG